MAESYSGGGSGRSRSRMVFRAVMVALLIMLLFYIARPLYWKISATVHDIRNNKQTLRHGISQIVMEAQKSVVGWYHDESDSALPRSTIRNHLFLR
ncbi:hypothetical protein RIF29_08111 [Crotalaria pallida]|uniref:Uncharacterized protein n=1 Tax=Crotalaria pallida TaxID=3830 RepID=A0AAN9J6M6_CROPI